MKDHSQQHLLSALGCASLLVLATASCRTASLVDTIPPRSYSATTLTITHDRIQKYWNAHGKAPAQPSDLPDEPNRDCSLTDGWGRDLYWESDGENKVKVWSLGQDGQPGGEGEDADMTVEFIGSQAEQQDFPKVQ